MDDKFNSLLICLSILVIIIVMRRDNLFQVIVVIAFGLLGAILGHMTDGTRAATIAGVAGGLFSGVLLSGLVLIIRGSTRKAKK